MLYNDTDGVQKHLYVYYAYRRSKVQYYRDVTHTALCVCI